MWEPRNYKPLGALVSIHLHSYETGHIFTTFMTVDWQQKTSGTRGPARGPATECCHNVCDISPGPILGSPEVRMSLDQEK